MKLALGFIALCALLIWGMPAFLSWRRLKGAGQHFINETVKEDLLGSSNTDKGLSDMMIAHPTSPLPAIRWVEIKLEEKSWDEAVERSKVVRARFPRDVDAYLLGVRALIGKGEFDLAEAESKLAIKRFPSSFLPLTEFASVAHQRKDWPEACRRWAELQRRFPKVVRGYLWQGLALNEMGKSDEADKIFGEGMSKLDDSGRLEVAIHYAESAHRRSMWAEAVPRWQLARSLTDIDPIIYLKGSEALRKVGKEQEADEWLADALFLFPKHPAVARIRETMNVAGDAAGSAQ